MSFKIAIASGKGGTGKTTVATNLFHWLLNHQASSIQLVDCDVEEPNDLIFFQNQGSHAQEDVHQLIPKIHTNKCTYCKKCVEYCVYNAIAILPSAGIAEIDNSLCHSCGACLVACSDNAITEHPIKVGDINTITLNEKSSISEGRLKIGSPMQTFVIKKLKEKTASKADITIYDAPPGTSCSVVETVSDADYVILVTEPTPFGLYDLKLTIELLRDMDKPFGIVINKAGLGNDKTHQLLKDENIDLLCEIPFDENYAAAYSTGHLFENIPSQIVESYTQLASKIQAKIVQS